MTISKGVDVKKMMQTLIYCLQILKGVANQSTEICIFKQTVVLALL